MFFGIVMLCLDADVSDCRLFYNQPFASFEECAVGVVSDAQALDAVYTAASVQDIKCVKFSNGEPV